VDGECTLSVALIFSSYPFYTRYLGTAPEPRPGPSSGHIPHSLSIPFVAFLRTHEVIEEKFTTYRTPDEIIDLLIEVVGENQLEQIMTGERTVVTSCGSGITAGILWLGLKLIGAKNVALYDEVSLTFVQIVLRLSGPRAQSWTGYAARKSSRIEKSR
jgi:thiosulfate/3-mercaptopyruvate sulfurtransferase